MGEHSRSTPWSHAFAILLVALALLGGCASSAPWWPTDLDQEVAEARRVEGVDAQVLRDQTEVRFRVLPDGIAAHRTTHLSAIVLTTGKDTLRHVHAVYQAEFDTLTRLDVRVLPADGSEPRQYSLRDGFDRPFVSGVEFLTDRRVTTVDAGPLVRGDRIDYRIETLRRRPELFDFGSYFAPEFPTNSLTFSVRFPRDAQLLTDAKREGADWQPRESTDGNEIRWDWELTHLPGKKADHLAPPTRFVAPHANVMLTQWVDGAGRQQSGYASPEQAAAWLANLSENPRSAALRADPEVTELLASVAQETPQERAARLYLWVRDQIKYCAIEVGIGGWRPADPDEVVSGRYGDCKGKANLLRELLAAAGVDSHLVSIDSGYGMTREYGLPAPTSHFNHAILEVSVPGASQLCDPTSSVAPFDRLPLSDQGRLALRIRKVDGDVFHSPPPSPSSHSALVDATIRLRSDGDAEGSAKVVSTGFEADRIRSAYMDAPQDERWRAVSAGAYLQTANWTEPRFDRIEPLAVDRDVYAFANLRMPKLMPATGRTRTFRVRDILSDQIPDGSSNPYPRGIQTDRVRRLEQTIRVQLPEGMRLASRPDPIELTAGGTHYALSVSTSGTAVIIHRVYEVSHVAVPPDAVPEFLKLLERAHAAELQSLVVLVEGGAQKTLDNAKEGTQ